MLLFCSLFSATAVMAFDVRPFDQKSRAWSPNMARLEVELQAAVKALKISKLALEKAEQNLLETDKHNLYVSTKETWHFCLDQDKDDYYHKNPLCKGIRELQAVALNKLKEHSLYQKQYLPCLQEHDRNEQTVAMLSRAREFAAERGEHHEWQKESMLNALDSKKFETDESLSKFYLGTSYDYAQVWEQARQDVRKFIEGLE